MQPLQAVPMPSHGVILEIHAQNSWPTLVSGVTVRTAYVATDSDQRLSFAALQSAIFSGTVLRLAARPSRFNDMPHGVVIELHLSQELQPGDIIYIALAQAGAATYYPPQQIDDHG